VVILDARRPRVSPRGATLSCSRWLKQSGRRPDFGWLLYRKLGSYERKRAEASIDEFGRPVAQFEAAARQLSPSLPV
jgi:hypothetical protein